MTGERALRGFPTRRVGQPVLQLRSEARVRVLVCSEACTHEHVQKVRTRRISTVWTRAASTTTIWVRAYGTHLTNRYYLPP